MQGFKKDDIESISISLTSKIIEILDTIELYRDNLKVKEVINHLAEITVLLRKYQGAKKNLSENFI